MLKDGTKTPSIVLAITELVFREPLSGQTVHCVLDAQCSCRTVCHPVKWHCIVCQVAGGCGNWLGWFFSGKSLTAACHLWLASAGPEDQRQRLWQAHWLRLQAWLLPQHGAEAHAQQQLLEDASEGFIHRRSSASGRDLTAAAASDAQAARRDIGAEQAAAAAESDGGQLRAAADPASQASQAGGQADAARESTADVTAAADQAAAAREHVFDAAELYAAVKPSGQEPKLEQHLPELRPRLLAFQARAAAWMVAREQGRLVRPANPFLQCFALQKHCSAPSVKGTGA